jgi:NAD+ kinase
LKITQVLVVLKRSALSRLKGSKSRGDVRLRKLAESGHPSTLTMRLAHEEHLLSVKHVRRELRRRDIRFVERSRAPKTGLASFDLVITVGGDGTLLDASHYVRHQLPMLGVNSAPASSVGFLTACRAPTFAQTLDALVADEIKPIAVQRLRVQVGRTTLPEPVLNDVLFCHDNPAMVTRYRVQTPHGEELQQSSGIWVATPAGSTAALRSAGGTPMSLTARSFAFIVREPYSAPGSSLQLTGEMLESDEKLVIESRVNTASLFIDGSYQRHPVHYGDVVTFSLHPTPLQLVRPRPRS